MNSIVYVGMDVHKEQYTVCCYTYEKDKVEYKQTLPSDYRLILKYLDQVRTKYKGQYFYWEKIIGDGGVEIYTGV